MTASKINVGGQAVHEGVMMRSPQCFAVVVRRKNGNIIVREQPWESVWASRLSKIPFARGVVTLVESLRNGYSALTFSAEQMEQDLNAEEEVPADALAEAQEAATGKREIPQPIPTNTTPVSEAKPSSSGSASGAGTRLGIVVAIAFFIALPQLLAWGTSKFFGPGWNLKDFKFHALTGFFKLTILLVYLSLIRRIPEIRRVFQYHGAEHKAIATYEAGLPLTVENAKKFSTRHARCGTTFLIVVVMVSILVYAALLPPFLGNLTGGQAQLFAIALKICFLPLIAGFAYELQRLGARFSSNPISRLLLIPGFWVQGITTIEPNEEQLEVALASLRVTLHREQLQKQGQSAMVTQIVQTFPSFEACAARYSLG